jgi:hypothetical protein
MKIDELNNIIKESCDLVRDAFEKMTLIDQIGFYHTKRKMCDEMGIKANFTGFDFNAILDAYRKYPQWVDLLVLSTFLKDFDNLYSTVDTRTLVEIVSIDKLCHPKLFLECMKRDTTNEFGIKFIEKNKRDYFIVRSIDAMSRIKFDNEELVLVYNWLSYINENIETVAKDAVFVESFNRVYKRYKRLPNNLK